MNAVYNSFVEKYAAVNYEDENSELTKTTKKRIKVGSLLKLLSSCALITKLTDLLHYLFIELALETCWI